MSSFKRAPVSGGPPKADILRPLKATQMIDSRPRLPAEILSTVLDALPVPDLLRFAGTSRRMREMVYDDTRWVQRLRAMGCWDESEARHRHGDGGPKHSERPGSSETPKGHRVSTQRAAQQRRISKGGEAIDQLTDGFEDTHLSAQSAGETTLDDTPLRVLSHVKSIRGCARQEYGRVYKTLEPVYRDIVKSDDDEIAIAVRTYSEPEQQAQLLAQLQSYSNSDWAEGWRQRKRKLDAQVNVFKTAVLRELDQGLQARDYDGNVKRFVQIMFTLDSGSDGVELFIEKNPVIEDKESLGVATDATAHAFSGSISLAPCGDFFQKLSTAVIGQINIIKQVFPNPAEVVILFLRRVGREVVSEYLSPLFSLARENGIEMYLRAVSGACGHALRFTQAIHSPEAPEPRLQQVIDDIARAIFEPHVDTYLQEELDFFKTKADVEVGSWEKQLSEQDKSTESFFMSNINRQADKRDFLSSFKKVVMMPVNALPTIPLGSPFAGSKPAAAPNSLGNGNVSETARAISPSQPEAPTTELAAKAAIMNSRLEGIRSLFSIEVALNLVHYAKASLERAAMMVLLGGSMGEKAKIQCVTIFVLLLNILGSRHIRPGFTTAVEHLSKYNPREVSEHNQPGVAPLVTFLELVNVGDLIQQMVDVFYEQELVAARLTDRNDFLDPAIKEKRRFEQMLDERVAAGLNKGIEVLMNEVEYLCATTQAVTDFNPNADGTFSSQTIDIGPTATAIHIVDVVSSHTKMLIGSTEKNMLDVFNQEVGLRLFTALCKHLKRQRISVDGAIKLISDMNHYATYIATLRNATLLQYFAALRELAQIYLVAPADAKELSTIIADADRFGGVLSAEEVYEFAERRADWLSVKREVERGLYGFGCGVM
ncbi:MAG: F-box protein: endocytic membrane traffic, recycling ReCYcling 1 [Caeruleum heppii]|nr:MAG: F-box protein: endocytic membrane traffic, recycling ReCYcling 1 [Caeruleum heppii]